MKKRCAGILCPVSALPSRFGIGTFGDAAYRFGDFLSAAGQSLWQVLPLGPTGFGDSPYQCASSYAGNPYFIDLEEFISDSILTEEELSAFDCGDDPDSIDYGKIYNTRGEILHRVFQRSPERYSEEFRQFREDNACWLNDYALYCSVKAYFGMSSWDRWDDDIRFRTAEGIEKYQKLLSEEIEYHSFVQYLFYRQWNRLHQYLLQKGIRVIGDLPIYVPYDSADVWVHPSLFLLDEDLKPRYVAGVPPDYFTKTGQLWGNPVYNYQQMEEDGFKWWTDRIRASAKLYDSIRIDHFRGFESFWAVPFGEETAVNGEWMPGPGIELVQLLKKAVPDTEIIAEDLGVLTPAVKQLLTQSGLPGMRVLSFGFTPDSNNMHRPHNVPKHCVYYFGTHDNDTAQGWIDNEPVENVALAVDYLNLTEREGMCFGLLRGVWGSQADTAIVQIQDVLELPSSARINLPGTTGNWRFRMRPDALDGKLAQRIAYYMMLFGR